MQVTIYKAQMEIMKWRTWGKKKKKKKQKSAEANRKQRVDQGHESKDILGTRFKVIESNKQERVDRFWKAQQADDDLI